MSNFLIHVIAIQVLTIFVLSGRSYAASTQDLGIQKRTLPPPQLLQKKKRHVTINEQKFQLMSQQNDHWLLYDTQLGQYCITLNQLVVVTSDLEALLHKAGWPYHAKEWEALAKQTYRWSGPFDKLLHLHRKLKPMPDIRLEWQLQYLPQSKNAEM